MGIGLWDANWCYENMNKQKLKNMIYFWDYRKLDGKRVGSRSLIVEPFRYRGGDPRYRRAPPKHVKRGQYRIIVTNLDTNVKAQELRDWAEGEKLDSVTITDVYNRHGMPRVKYFLCVELCKDLCRLFLCCFFLLF